ncbi:hypothetical protein F2Q69_00021999 [Brassica cretica]|uniref:Uncharacterized protein n=1 Tax=Brassica cretica TaxID=69181 RepID=A0A8S9QS55_BRACR|nr:hypothetical protein F2Q69_00021999 [Brassica cretica]
MSSSKDKCQVSEDKDRDRRKMEYFHGAINSTEGRKGKGPLGNLGFPNFLNLNGNRECEFWFPRFGARRRGGGTDQSNSQPPTLDQTCQPTISTTNKHRRRDNVENTPATNVTAVNFNTAVFEEVQKMFSTFQKKSEEWDKVISSFAKHVENLTARTRAVLPRGTTRVHGRRLNFVTPSNRSDNAHGKTSGQNPNKTTHAPTRDPLSWKTRRKEKSDASLGF